MAGVRRTTPTIGDHVLFPRATWFPTSAERTFGCDLGQKWQQEASEFADEARQVTGLVSESASTDERPPLENTSRIVRILLRKADRFGFDYRPAVPKRSDDRIRQTLAIKRIHAG
jgi:hypothetical protein